MHGVKDKKNLCRYLNHKINRLKEQYKEYFMKNEAAAENAATEVFVDLNNGEYLQFDMTLPIQILFDDVMNFVSKTDFE